MSESEYMTATQVESQLREGMARVPDPRVDAMRAIVVERIARGDIDATLQDVLEKLDALPPEQRDGNTDVYLTLYLRVKPFGDHHGTPEAGTAETE